MPRTAFALALCVTAVALACSSVPDVHFGDGGASSSSSSGGVSDGGATDAAVESGPVTPDWACPSKPPPSGTGICCGSKICLHCTSADCTRCGETGCSGTTSSACCLKTNGMMQCHAWDSCN